MFNHMVEHGQQLDRTYGALSHSVRRDLLARLRSGPAAVTTLAEPYGMSLAAVSKHIRVLEDAGLLDRAVDGRTHFLALRPQRLFEARSWFDAYRTFWEGRLDALEAHLAETARR